MPTNKPEVVLPEPYIKGEFGKSDLYTADQLRAYGQACIDTLTRPADGEFVMVPREATEAMLLAVSGWTESVPVAEDDFIEYPVSTDLLADAYREMLSAAPQQPAEAVAWRQSVTKEVSCYDCRGVGSHHVSNNYSAKIVQCDDCGGTGRKVETITFKTDWLKENYPSAWIMGEQLGDGPVQIGQVEFDRLVQLAHTRQAIDIGKLLAEARRNYRDSDAAGDVLDWLEEQAALIGDGGEKGNG